MNRLLLGGAAGAPVSAGARRLAGAVLAAGAGLRLHAATDLLLAPALVVRRHRVLLGSAGRLARRRGDKRRRRGGITPPTRIRPSAPSTPRALPSPAPARSRRGASSAGPPAASSTTRACLV